MKQQFVYLAGKLLHCPFLPVVDEDAADGTLAMFDAAGKITWQKQIAGGRVCRLDATADGSLIAVGASRRIDTLSTDGHKSALADYNANRANMRRRFME